MNNPSQPIYFREISLENVRCFGKKQVIRFTDKAGKTARWSLVLGENGIGKTTLLKSIVVSTIFNRRHFKEIDLLYFQRSKDKRPQISFKLGNIWTSSVAEIYEESEKNSYLTEWDIECFGPQLMLEDMKVFGYGAARIIGETSLSKDKSDFPASNLFNDSTTLINAEEWLVQQEYLGLKRFKGSNGNSESYVGKVMNILVQLFKNEISEVEIRTQENTPKAFFKTKYGWVKLHDLSLGYKSLIAWMVDLASRLMDAYPESKNPLHEPAVVLVDEIDLHLHPSFQRELISFLTDTFKKVQFIVTAHSPLIVQSMEEANIILLDRKGDSVVVTQNPVDVQSWRVDQILTSDLFGLSSPRSKSTERLLERRRKILAKPELSEKDKKDLEKLNAEVEKIPLGESHDEISGFEKLKKFAQKLGAQ